MRVLFLHGFSQNKYKFEIKTRGIKSSFSDSDELVYLDGPIEVDSKDDQIFVNHPTSFKEPYPGNEETSRSWWVYQNTGNKSVAGFEDTLRYLEYIMETMGPFDGVVGFSQGGILGSILASILDKKDRGEIKFQGQPPLKFVIIVGGGKPESPTLLEHFDRTISCKALIVIGKWDTVVSIERALLLSECFEGPKLIYHDGGHIVPLTSAIIQESKHFIESVRE